MTTHEELRVPIEDEALDKVCENITDMVRLHKEQIETYAKMVKLVRFAQLIGMNPKDIKGQANYRITPGPTSDNAWHKAYLRVEYAKGSDQAAVAEALKRMGQRVDKFPIADVPVELWPDDMLKDWRRRASGQFGKGMRLKYDNEDWPWV